MDFDKIKYFISLSEIGSFKGAARHHFISQSTLSKHMKNLESELGATLINRFGSNAKPTLTNEGKIFLNYAYSAYASYLTMRRLIDESALNKKDTLRIGMLPLSSQGPVMDFCNKFWLKKPELQMTITERSQAELINYLKLGVLALAFVRTDFLDDNYIEYVNLFSDRLVFACHKNHLLAHKKKVSLSQLKNETFIYFEANSELHRYCTELFKEQNVSFKKTYYQTRHKAILSAVDNAVGVSILPSQLTQNLDFTNVRVLPFDEDYITTIGLAHLREAEVSEIQQEFMEYILQKFRH